MQNKIEKLLLMFKLAMIDQIFFSVLYYFLLNYFFHNMSFIILNKHYNVCLDHSNFVNLPDLYNLKYIYYFHIAIVKI